ncbi:Dyp-type peroxidase [Ramaria rubella]|nr:Dyp-type peroxidase [Ramaria rubella]
MSQPPATIPPPPSSPVDLKDVQGDIILGIPKRVEDFIFFTIAGNDNAQSFRRVVGSKEFLSLITSTAQVQEYRKQINEHKAQYGGKECPLIPLSAVNIAFTQSGLNALGLTDDLGDPAFKAGQLAHAQALGDTGTTVNGVFIPSWFPEFKGEIHGIILIAGDSVNSVHATEQKLLALLGHTIKQVFKVPARVRPGNQKGHEHFGYLDGVSNPAVKGIVTPFPGQQVIDPGVLLLGQTGDTVTRPAWAKNGSILVYRHLDQLVPEFDKFKRDNALNVAELGVDQGAELLGSRFFGRWKSGAPIDITPLKDDPVLAADPQRNNNFDFSNKSFPQPTDQSHCPFAAHIRKVNPRSDLAQFGGVPPHSITRTSIAFGPEVTDKEHKDNKTEHERGLAFVCYQSNLADGFEFLQEAWANSPSFIFGKQVDGKPFSPGFDPIIGQNGGDPKGREMGGFNPAAQGSDINLPIEWVVSKGGAYFFSPSISVLGTKLGISN